MVSFTLRKTSIAGCIEISFRVVEDARGRFVKVLQRSEFTAQGLPAEYTDHYFTESREGVVRGLHFQSPPQDHEKLVFCVAGAVVDAVVDLRRSSPTFRRFELFDLSAETGNAVFVPRGLAHGFCVPRGSATMVYFVTSEHSPANDTGILWNSAGIPWPVKDPILSDRDRHLPPFDPDRTPFP